MNSITGQMMCRTTTRRGLCQAAAIVAGEKQFETEIDGRPWVQPSFPYQAKCLRWTREEFGALSESDQQLVRTMLEPAGLLPLVDEAI